MCAAHHVNVLCRGALEESGIIPGVIDRVSAASCAELEVSFGGKRVENGVLISPADAAATPTARIKGGSEGALYTLVCPDPDAPDPAHPVRGEWLHWIVTNIPAAGDASEGNEVGGRRHAVPLCLLSARPPPVVFLHALTHQTVHLLPAQITSWRGPAPPIGTHRYIFLLYQQPNQEPLQVGEQCLCRPPGEVGAERAACLYARNSCGCRSKCCGALHMPNRCARLPTPLAATWPSARTSKSASGRLSTTWVTR